jgi:GNAT superfamily N-acetyltransferase
MLCCSLEDARNDRGGHLPVAVVERVQTEIISPHGVANLWGATGHRFVLSRRVDASTSELLATILVGRRKGTIFFLTGRYNNLRHSQIAKDVDFAQPAGSDPAQRWFDQFAFPDLIRFKPTAYHQIANFVVAREHRREGLAERLLAAIVEKYSRNDIEARGAPIEHSQYLLCGRGLWQIGDPPWLARMEKLGFYLRWGAESFFIEHDWAPLPPIFDRGRGSPTSTTTDPSACRALPGRTPAAARDAITCSTASTPSSDSRKTPGPSCNTSRRCSTSDEDLSQTRRRSAATQQVAPFTGEGAYHGSTKPRPAPANPPPRRPSSPRCGRAPLDKYDDPRAIEAFAARFPNRHEHVAALPVPSQEAIMSDAVTFCWCPIDEAIREAGPLTRSVLEEMQRHLTGRKRYVYIDSKIQYFQTGDVPVDSQHWHVDGTIVARDDACAASATRSSTTCEPGSRAPPSRPRTSPTSPPSTARRSS